MEEWSFVHKGRIFKRYFFSFERRNIFIKQELILDGCELREDPCVDFQGVAVGFGVWRPRNGILFGRFLFEFHLLLDLFFLKLCL